MIIWAIVTVLLLIGKVVYCTARIIADFRGPRPASGVWGMLALVGALSALVLAVAGTGAAMSGI